MPYRINAITGELDLIASTSTGDSATSFDTDSGSAAPTVAGVLTVSGGTGINTAGAGSTLTINLDNPVTVANGGTGVAVLTDGGILLGSGTSSVTTTGQPSNGQLLIGRTGLDPILGTLTAGVGISITEASGSITIGSSSGGLNWNVETGTSDSMVSNNGYIANNAGTVTYTLPGTANVGDVFKVTGLQGAWVIAQNAGNTIHFSDQSTTTGVGGSLASTDARDAVEIICVVADLDYQVISSVGNITVT